MESNCGGWISIAESPEYDQEKKDSDESHESRHPGSDIDNDDVQENSPVSNDLSLSRRHEARSLSPVDIVCAPTLNRWKQEEDETPSSKQRGASFQGKDDPVAAYDEPDNDISGNAMDEVGSNESRGSMESANVVEAERNKRLKSKLREKIRELAEKEDEIKNAEAYVWGVQDDLDAANKKVKKLESSVSAVCSTMKTLTESISQVNENIDWDPPQEVTRSLADELETKELRRRFEEFIAGVHNRIQFQQNHNQFLERKLNDQAHKFAIFEKAKMAEENENLAMSPLSPRWVDRTSFESLYNEEKAKRKVAEGKLQNVQEKVENKCSQEIKELQDKLATMQEKNATLGQKLEHASHLEEEFKAANSRSQQREDAFEMKTQEQQDEINRYIEDYYGKTGDAKYWEPTFLQKQLTAKQEELATKNKMFKEVDMENVGLRNKVNKLEESNNLLEIQMRQLEQILPSHFYTMTSSYKPKQGGLSQLSSLSISSEPSSPRQANGDGNPSLQDTRKKRKAMLAEQIEARRKAREDDSTLDKMIKKLREQKMGEFYPPRKTGWRETKEMSAWERWGGDEWVKKQSVTNEEERVLRAKGLWSDTS
jgi:chromosome segregation ATPase